MFETINQINDDSSQIRVLPSESLETPTNCLHLPNSQTVRLLLTLHTLRKLGQCIDPTLFCTVQNPWPFEAPVACAKFSIFMSAWSPVTANMGGTRIANLLLLYHHGEEKIILNKMNKCDPSAMGKHGKTMISCYHGIAFRHPATCCRSVGADACHDGLLNSSLSKRICNPNTEQVLWIFSQFKEL